MIVDFPFCFQHICCSVGADFDIQQLPRQGRQRTATEQPFLSACAQGMYAMSLIWCFKYKSEKTNHLGRL